MGGCYFGGGIGVANDLGPIYSAQSGIGWWGLPVWFALGGIFLWECGFGWGAVPDGTGSSSVCFTPHLRAGLLRGAP